uniref:Uncharacterized protein n=1 Tax=Plectus sambesii TaxID=2011161 RepID=A0A914UGF4_9BILA
MKEIETILSKQQGKRRKRAGLDSLTDMRETIKQFLLQQFGNEVTVPPTPQSTTDLPFTGFNSTSDFQVVWLPKMTYYKFMGAFMSKMQSVFAGKSWFPAQELSIHVSMCGYPQMQSYTAIMEGIKFNTTTGGTMAYFQVSCRKKADDVIVGISYYGTSFGVKSVAQEKQVTKEWNALLNNAKQNSVATQMYDDSTLTVNQMNLLVNYLRGFILRNVNQLFRDYLQTYG